MPQARKIPSERQVKFLAERKALKAGTFVRITKTKPRGYAMEGIFLADVQVGKPVYVAGMERSDLVDGTFTSAPVDGVSPEGFTAGFTAAGAIYCVEMLGEPGEFSFLAEVLLREMKPRGIGALVPGTI